MDLEHRILNILEHAWPYVSGVVLTVGAGAKLWWHSKKEIKRRIVNLEKLAEYGATQADLRDCRDGVDKQDAENLDTVLNEIKSLRADIKQDTKENTAAHAEITKTMLQLYAK